MKVLVPGWNLCEIQAFLEIIKSFIQKLKILAELFFPLSHGKSEKLRTEEE